MIILKTNHDPPILVTTSLGGIGFVRGIHVEFYTVLVFPLATYAAHGLLLVADELGIYFVSVGVLKKILHPEWHERFLQLLVLEIPLQPRDNRFPSLLGIAQLCSRGLLLSVKALNFVNADRP